MEASMDMVDEDRISNLPSCVIDLILSFLPMRDVLRTSILSTKWRYQWTSVPKLVFVENPLHPSMIHSESSRALANIINHVLLLHTGSVEVLHIVDLCGIPDIDHWVIFVSRKAIKEFVLKLQDTVYTLHSSLYNCQSLVTLHLSCCSLKPPLYFTGWKSLKCLHLGYVTLFDGNTHDENDDAFNSMISSCPLLEALSLHRVREIGNLHINAQNLRYLNVTDFYDNITFGCTMPKLEFLSVDFLNGEDYDSAYSENSLTEFFINLPYIHRLTLTNSFMRYLTSVGVIPERLSFPLIDLRHLDIWFDNGDQRQGLAALCLFKSLPDLIELVITLRECAYPAASMSSIWKSSVAGRRIFEKLRFVTIFDISHRKPDFALVKFMLAESPVLEKMIIARSDCKEKALRKSMTKFTRASAEAEIIFR